MKTSLKRKDKCPFSSDQIVRATRSFVWEGGAVNQGDRYRANHPAVQAGWSNFVPGDTPDHELENLFAAMGDLPVHHDSHVRIPAAIPPHRQVVATVDLYRPGSWAPGSPGEKAGGPPPPFGAMVCRRGSVYDALTTPYVAEHPEHFNWPQRQVTREDLDRLARTEYAEGGGSNG
jgi:hypothetical protein